MRSLVHLLAGKQASEPVRDAAGRPEALRRKTLAFNAQLTIAGSALLLPVALYGIVHGVALPFVLVVIGLATGMLSLALHQREQYELAAAAQVYSLLLAAVVLAVADAGFVDVGLGVALLAPVHAALLARRETQYRSWLGLAAVLVLAAVAATAGIHLPETGRSEFTITAGSGFAIAVLIVAVSARRIGSAFVIYDRSQINAYRHLLEHVQDAVLRFSSEGALIFASRSAETLLGCRRYELAGSGVLDRIHVLDRPSYLTAFAEANRDGRTRRVEIRMRRDDSGAGAAMQFVWVEVALSPVLDPREPRERHEVVALLRDVTERRDQENEMRRARKLAEEASSAKSRFLATIGHELRTPLNAIVGFSEMMSAGVGGDLSPQHKEYATLIQQSGRHLIEVVGMLLDMSRIEAGKFELQTESFQPETLVEPCLTMVDGLARDKNIRVVTDVAKSLPMLVADERACRQILINLLSNAIKFSHDDAVVRLAMKRQGQHINVSVTDNGIGMEAEALQRIGEPFYQAQDGLARRYEGTGLGLSIVKGLVDLHDGSLHVVSSPGEGTTMTILLPINGPAIKVEETASITPLHRDPVPQQMPSWRDEKRRAL